jgi:hypothetical protein
VPASSRRDAALVAKGYLTSSEQTALLGLAAAI